MVFSVVPSDIYPVVRRFLVETGLQRTLKAFDKETVGDDGETPKPRKKVGRFLPDLELTSACQLWLEEKVKVAEDNGAARAKTEEDIQAEKATPILAQCEEETVPKKKRKRAGSGRIAENAEVAVEETVAADEEALPKPRRKRSGSGSLAAAKVVEAPDVHDAAAAAEEANAMPKKKNKKRCKYPEACGCGFQARR